MVSFKHVIGTFGLLAVATASTLPLEKKQLALPAGCDAVGCVTAILALPAALPTTLNLVVTLAKTCVATPALLTTCVAILPLVLVPQVCTACLPASSLPLGL
ncbi:hypothetical protein M422DRAFT_35211 [Sphaerobolus stellatus SS14]|uniref:Uncharacterized protein n=1 Tax=Sphaerobolus stellatus (strain SS14) TaxID=990650 RepID=A0A0C9V9Z7_SPHS4|nr:hypothetical protein M422DRAFT_35211 [Sphaerobolus stellatus SS14]